MADLMRSGSVHPASPDTQSRTLTWAALNRPVRPGKSVGVAGSAVTLSDPHAASRSGSTMTRRHAATRPRAARGRARPTGDGAIDGRLAPAPRGRPGAVG